MIYAWRMLDSCKNDHHRECIGELNNGTTVCSCPCHMYAPEFEGEDFDP